MRLLSLQHGRVLASERRRCERYVKQQAGSGLVRCLFSTKATTAAAALHVAVTGSQACRERMSGVRSVASDALWACYGEQSTRWFHRLGKQREHPKPLTCLRIDESLVSLADVGGVASIRGEIERYFGGIKVVVLCRNN